MNRVLRRLRAFGRRVASIIVSSIRIALIVALVFLPLPMGAFIAAFFAPKRDDPSAEMVRDPRERERS